MSVVTQRVCSSNIGGHSATQPYALPSKPSPGQSSLLEGWSWRGDLQPVPHDASLPSQPDSYSPAPHYLEAQAPKLSPGLQNRFQPEPHWHRSCHFLASY